MTNHYHLMMEAPDGNLSIGMQHLIGMAKAYLSGGYSMREMGEFFGVHYMIVSRAVRWFENQNVRCET